MDRELVRHIASLSNILLSAEEEERYAKEFEKILEYMGKIKEVVDSPHLETIKHREQVFREDEIKPSLPISSIKKLSKYMEDCQFKVPKVIY